jgi:hypothetical protein
VRDGGRLHADAVVALACSVSVVRGWKGRRKWLRRF